MTPDDVLTADPFVDQASSDQASTQEAPIQQDSTLVLGRNVSLTLGTDSLIVLDETIPTRRPLLTTCCGLLPSLKLSLKLQTQTPLPTRSIAYYNILDATLNEYDLTIVYASPPTRRSKVLRPTCVAYPVPKDLRPLASAFLDTLLTRAYPRDVPRYRRIKVLVNPFGGQGSAPKWYNRDIEPIFRAAGCELNVEHTRYKGHAREIAEKFDASAYDVVACCSGDGLPHEVFNGLAKQPDARRALASVAVVQLPCGTGNAMSINLNGTDSPSAAALAVVKGEITPLDLMAVTQVIDGREERYLSFLSQSFGIVADTDLGTENLRWMGDARFTVGFLARIFGKTTYPAAVSVQAREEDKRAIRRHCRDYRLRQQQRDSTAGRDNENVPSGPLLPPATSASSSIETLTDAGWSPSMPMPTLGNFYSGNMPFMARDLNFFQAALPADGCLDLITIDGNIPRRRALAMMLATARGTLFDFEEVKYRKCTGYRVVPAQKRGYVSVDGESVPCVPFQVEVLQGLGRVLSRRGSFECVGVE